MNELGHVSHWVFTWGLPLLATVWLYRRRTLGRLLFLSGLAITALVRSGMHIVTAKMLSDLRAAAVPQNTYWYVRLALFLVYLVGMIVALVGFARIVRREDNEADAQ